MKWFLALLTAQVIFSAAIYFQLGNTSHKLRQAMVQKKGLELRGVLPTPDYYVENQQILKIKTSQLGAMQQIKGDFGEKMKQIELDIKSTTTELSEVLLQRADVPEVKSRAFQLYDKLAMLKNKKNRLLLEGMLKLRQQLSDSQFRAFLKKEAFLRE